MIDNLSRDISILQFWEEKDLEKLEDPQLMRTIRKEQREFIVYMHDLMQIIEENLDIFEKKYFNFENVKWILIHLVSRTFGTHLEYVTLVPICEFMNHDCSDVYYDFD